MLYISIERGAEGVALERHPHFSSTSSRTASFREHLAKAVSDLDRYQYLIPIPTPHAPWPHPQTAPSIHYLQPHTCSSARKRPSKRSARSKATPPVREKIDRSAYLPTLPQLLSSAPQELATLSLEPRSKTPIHHHRCISDCPPPPQNPRGNVHRVSQTQDLHLDLRTKLSAQTIPRTPLGWPHITYLTQRSTKSCRARAYPLTDGHIDEWRALRPRSGDHRCSSLSVSALRIVHRRGGGGKMLRVGMVLLVVGVDVSLGRVVVTGEPGDPTGLSGMLLRSMVFGM